MPKKALYKRANDPWSNGQKACKDGRAKEKRFLDSLESETVNRRPKRKIKGKIPKLSDCYDYILSK